MTNETNSNNNIEVEEETMSYEEFRQIEYEFDCWFSNLLTETKQLKDKAFITVPKTIEEVADCITDEDLDFMCYSAGWFEDVIHSTDKRNAVYWYAVHLLYLYNDDVVEEGKCWLCGKEFDYSALFTFLNDLQPFGN